MQAGFLTDHTPIRADQRWRDECIRYSICTIVTRLNEYAEMLASFRAGGFKDPDCELLYLDNTHGNVFDAYSGKILCHQDIVLLEDRRACTPGRRS